MTLAAIARLSRRHLPVVMTPSRLGGARTTACVHEPGRLPSPLPRHPLGRLLPCPGRQLGGVSPLPPLLQSQRRMNSGLDMSLGSPAFSTEDHTKMVKHFAALVRFSCHGEGHMASVEELGAAAAVLQADMRALKKRTFLFMLILFSAVLLLQVLFKSLSRHHKANSEKTSKYKSKLHKVQDEDTSNGLKAQELRQRAVVLLGGAADAQNSDKSPKLN